MGAGGPSGHGLSPPPAAPGAAPSGRHLCVPADWPCPRSFWCPLPPSLSTSPLSHPPSHSATHPVTHSLSHSLITHSFINSPTHSFINHPLIHFLPPSLIPALSHSFSHSVVYSLTHHIPIHPLTNSLTHLFAHSFIHSLIHRSVIHFLTHSSLIHSLIHPLTHLFTRSFIPSLPHSLPYSVTHSLTDSYNQHMPGTQRGAGFYAWGSASASGVAGCLPCAWPVPAVAVPSEGKVSIWVKPLGTRLRLSGSQGQMREDASRGEVHLNESPQSQNTECLPHQPSITDRSSFRPAASGGLCGNQGPRRGLGSGAAGGGPEQGVQATPPDFHGATVPQGSIQGS